MNESGPKVKQQIIEKIRSSTNILITVSNNPSVDELSAAIGLTTILNKLGKHGTAIFSGDIPPAINFLDPDKIFENTADSLRDFIIALDKEKADHLRYKVEGDVVKIFITPYRTTINQNDLDFSQGDYNVELVIALGVDNKEHLDAALSAHEGKVLQDVAIATFSAGRQSSQLGSMDWRDSGASGLSEMVANISDSLKSDKTNILDKQISTALLTGIVSATDRFSNLLTSARVMTTAAQLMAAGADQQLIAAKLRETHEIEKIAKIPTVQKIKKPRPIEPPVIEPDPIPTSTLPVGSLVIEHDLVDEAKKNLESESPSLNITNSPNNISLNIPPAKVKPKAAVPAPVASTTAPLQQQPSENVQPEAATEPALSDTLGIEPTPTVQNNQSDILNNHNSSILTHAYLGDSQTANNLVQPEEPKAVDIFSEPPESQPSPEPTYANNIPTVQVPIVNQPFTAPIGAQPIAQPPLPDLPLPPQIPDFTTLPPISPAMTGYTPPIDTPQADFNVQQPQPVSSDPGQFRIPN